MSDDDVQMAITTARSLARTAQRGLIYACIAASASLFVGIVFRKWWTLAFAIVWCSIAASRREERNRNLRRLHEFGAVRWMGADPADFGRALPPVK